MLLSTGPRIHTLRHALLLGALTLLTLGTHAQNLNKNLCREFRETSTLYVISSDSDTWTYPNMEGQQRTFVQLVKEVWPEKNIVVMDQEHYEAQEDVKQLFFVAVSDFMVSTEQSEVSTLSSIVSMIFLKKGKIKYDPDHTVYASYLDQFQIQYGVASSRFINALKEMRAQTDHPEQGDRDKMNYTAEDFARKLHADTLYVQNKDVWIKSLAGATPEEKDLRDVYPYPLRLVSPEQWARVVDQRPEGVAYLEIIRGGSGAVVMIHEASDGALLRSTMRMFLNPKFFKELGHT